ncbi:hypothetical protein LDENG_00242270 [Lucifuga dentata]|nr:hypothetical protein LDENG_00242270 [Lucifuga dentata]
MIFSAIVVVFWRANAHPAALTQPASNEILRGLSSSQCPPAGAPVRDKHSGLLPARTPRCSSHCLRRSDDVQLASHSVFR